MREIVSIININEFELISEDEIEKYTLLLEKHNIHALTLFVLQDKEGMSNKMQYMKAISTLIYF